MKQLRIALLLLAALTLGMGAWSAPAQAKTYLAFGGGPVGGTYIYFSNAMASLLNNTYPGDMEVSSEGSGGSTANLKRAHKHDIDFGISYMGDCWLGRHGKLPKDTNKYDNVTAVAALYPAHAHLVTRRADGITSATQLAGKRVAVGNAGSGAAACAERFFTTLGLWDKMDKQFLGYSAAAAALNDGKLDAFWVFVGFPNASIIEAAARDDIYLIDVHKDAEAAGFYKEYPFYAPANIPAGTYPKQTEPTLSFQDAAWWIASKDVDADAVYKALKAVYSPEGLKHMVAAHKKAKEMKIKTALTGVAIPVHPGAAKFWKEQGLTVPDIKD